MTNFCLQVAVLGLGAPALLPAQSRWTVLLEDAPAVKAPHPAETLARHQALKHELASRGVRISSSTTNLINAVFIRATPAQAAALRAVPGVARVMPQRQYRPKMSKALDLVGAPAAWTKLGGQSKAGAGIIIGIIDSGIDSKHPALIDPTLTEPTGFPRCKPADCPYTSTKVIVARSYVSLLSDASDEYQSRPDDLTPRDHIGHGTAVAAIAAGLAITGPSAATGGVAPKAFLANYKVFGTPGVNDESANTFDEAIIQAIDDAYSDGVNVAVIALGAPALWGATDSGTTCGLTGTDSCDPVAAAVEAAVQAGMLVVAAAGNDGGTGTNTPTYGTINSPATAPSAIAVGATTNAHYFVSTVTTPTQTIDTQLSNGLKFNSPLAAPIVDAGGTACSALAANSLTGSIALIQNGDCDCFYKLRNVQQSGAIAAIIFQPDGVDSLYPIDGISTAGIPAVLIGNTDGRALQSYLSQNPGMQVTIDPALIVRTPPASYQDKVASFTSWGPTLADNLLKPEVVAPGTDLYIPSQSWDPNGALYHPSRYFVANGTSFSAAMVAGAAALVLQNNKKLTPGQLKSAIVNTAVAGIKDAQGNPARVLASGAGKLNVASAIATNVTIEPAVASFGVLTGTLPQQSFKLTNIGSTAVTLKLAVSSSAVSAPATVSIPAGQSTSIQIGLQGKLPGAGNYDGVISIAGAAVPLRLPYFYIVSDQVPANAYSLGGDRFVLSAETSAVRLSMKVTDQFGAPIVNRDATFLPLVDDATVDLASPSTDSTGIAEASVTLGPTPGYQGFSGQVGNVVVSFGGRARNGPQINPGGVINTASNRVESNVAPGSLITINGSGLADGMVTLSTPYLAWALAGASVSFYEPLSRISYAGRIVSVSDGAIIAQVPWELAGAAACTMKVSFGYFAQSDNYPLTLAGAVPAIFERADPSGSGTVAYAADNSGNLVDSSTPVSRGSQLQILASGLGPVEGTAPLTGEQVPNPPPAVQTPPAVTIEGQPSDVVSATLAPGLAGFYLINVTVPPGIDPGPQLLVVTVNNVAAKTVTIFIQ